MKNDHRLGWPPAAHHETRPCAVYGLGAPTRPPEVVTATPQDLFETGDHSFSGKEAGPTPTVQRSASVDVGKWRLVGVSAPKKPGVYQIRSVRSQALYYSKFSGGVWRTVESTAELARGDRQRSAALAGFPAAYQWFSIPVEVL